MLQSSQLCKFLRNNYREFIEYQRLNEDILAWKLLIGYFQNLIFMDPCVVV